MKSFSHVLSVIFHPVIMVTYATVVYFFLLPSHFGFYQTARLWEIIGMIFTGTALIPVAALVLLSKLGRIKSVQIEEQKERNFPLLIGSLIYFGTFYMLQNNKEVPIFILLFLLGAILGILISLGINLRWKISLHMIGIGGLCGGASVVMYLQQEGNPLLITLLFMVAGLLGTARLYLQAHTPAQIFAGFLMGFAVQSGLMLLMVR
ncbi:MAG: PAP2 family protein [Bacteroidota bacterium]|nr:PAP2 family protein [Bacteroidota bacterium]